MGFCTYSVSKCVQVWDLLGHPVFTIYRSGSIASSTVNWRKGSVTIPEKSEDGEEEDEATNCSVAVRIDDVRPRRLSESTPVKSA